MTEISKDILKKFGVNLKKLREKQGLTLVDLEVRSGIDNGDISKIEGGKINIAFTTLAKLAIGLNLPMTDLVNF